MVEFVGLYNTVLIGTSHLGLDYHRDTLGPVPGFKLLIKVSNRLNCEKNETLNENVALVIVSC